MGMQQTMPFESPSQVRVISPHAQLHFEGEVRALVVGGIPVLTWSDGDEACEAFGRVLLVKSGMAKAVDVARIFECGRATLYREIARFDEGGVAKLVRGKPGPKGPSTFDDALMRRVLALKAQDLGAKAIAAKLRVSKSGVRHALKRAGLQPAKPVQLEIASASAPAPVASPSPADRAKDVAAPAPCEAVAEPQGQAQAAETKPGAAPEAGQAKPMEDAWDRSADRVFARLGLLAEAAPQFGDAQGVVGLGVLLALPALMSTGLFEVAEKVYGGFGAAFYGVRSVFTCLSLMALLRVKRPEQLRHNSPPAMGRLLGLDRAPEVKTLRRKVDELAQQQKSRELQEQLARLRVEAYPGLMGFLYVDGHVRPYCGEVEVPKAHVTRMRLSMPATVDHWVNDSAGAPLLVITATPTAALSKEMLPIAEEIKKLLGERRPTVVFDRGGWSPKLFAKLVAMGFDVLTYRKGRVPRVRLARFERHEAIIDGRRVSYQLAERRLKLKYQGGQLALREVVRLSEDGEHQTSIVTSLKVEQVSTVAVAYRMFARWRQENFFKYMGEEFALDALVSYATEKDDAQRDVPNPERRAAERKLAKARDELEELERRLGAAAASNEESKRPTMRGFKIANAEVGKQLRAAQAKVERSREALAAIPKRVTAAQAAGGEAVVRLDTETKRLTDVVKMVAYQAETELFHMVRPHYSRHEDEGRKLISSAMQLAGDIEVALGELRINLQPAASPNRTRAIAKLCDELNASNTTYPGTRLKLRFSIREA